MVNSIKFLDSKRDCGPQRPTSGPRLCPHHLGYSGAVPASSIGVHRLFDKERLASLVLTFREIQGSTVPRSHSRDLKQTILETVWGSCKDYCDCAQTLTQDSSFSCGQLPGGCCCFWAFDGCRLVPGRREFQKSGHI